MSALSVTPLTSSIGAAVTGVQLADATDEDLVALQWALLEHKVLVLRDQELDDGTHERFATRWGDPVPHPVVAHLGGTQTVGVVYNDADHPPGDGEGWHTDHSWAPHVPDAAVLRAVTVPETGGDTLWSDVHAAYLALSPSMRAFLTGLTARHDPGPRVLLEMRARMPEDLVEEIATTFTGEDHPVIARHPITDRPGVFVNPGYTRCINGLDADESEAVLRMLFDLVGRPEFVCRLHWTEGTVAIWDEHATLHRGPNDYAPATRELHRFTVGATTPQPA